MKRKYKFRLVRNNNHGSSSAIDIFKGEKYLVLLYCTNSAISGIFMADKLWTPRHRFYAENDKQAKKIYLAWLNNINVDGETDFTICSEDTKKLIVVNKEGTHENRN